MIKYSLILLGVYFLYYAGNIVYDLFLKKDKVLQTGAVEEFSLGDFAEKNTGSPNQIGIEDVESINTPKSFTKSNLHSVSNAYEENIDIDDLRQRFEEEQDLDYSYANEDEKRESDTSSIVQESTIENISQPIIQKEQPSAKKMQWENIMQFATTSVQMVANYEGQKVYHSII